MLPRRYPPAPALRDLSMAYRPDQVEVKVLARSLRPPLSATATAIQANDALIAISNNRRTPARSVVPLAWYWLADNLSEVVIGGPHQQKVGPERFKPTNFGTAERT